MDELSGSESEASIQKASFPTTNTPLRAITRHQLSLGCISPATRHTRIAPAMSSRSATPEQKEAPKEENTPIKPEARERTASKSPPQSQIKPASRSPTRSASPPVQNGDSEESKASLKEEDDSMDEESPKPLGRERSCTRSPTRSPTPTPRRRSPSSPPRRRSPSPRRNGHREEPREMAARGGRGAASAPPVRTEEEKQAAAKAEYEKLLTMRSGGTYIPPARLRALQSQITDKSSKEYQRMAWEALKKSINGLINKVNVSNIKFIVPELFSENLVRGRGLFCRSIMKAQAASLPFTPIYAAMAAIVNTKLPQVGELLLTRLIIQFRKAFKRNDKAVCLSSTTFIAHLCNQQVAHEMVAAQILLLLLHKPTDDSVEIAVGLTRVKWLLWTDMSIPTSPTNVPN